MTGIAAGLRFSVCTAAVIIAVTGGLAGCSSGSKAGFGSSSGAVADPKLGHAQVGGLTISNAYIPAQSSPDEAAAYLTISNAGVADTLLSASTPAAMTVQLHETVDSGATGEMKPLSAVPVPAHGSVSFSVGARHLMLMGPPEMLARGDRASLTLTFKNAGKVVVSVPVIAATGP